MLQYAVADKTIAESMVCVVVDLHCTVAEPNKVVKHLQCWQ
jgi:hypothetical protein